jgi:hypothetical protein
VAVAAQRVGDGVADHRIVFDQQQAHGAGVGMSVA